MSEAVNRFYKSIKGAEELKQIDFIDLFAYFLTEHQGVDVVSAGAIDTCFRDCDLQAPGNTSAALTNGTKSKPPKFVKVTGGYRLHRSHRDRLAAHLGAEAEAIQTSVELRKLEDKVAGGKEKSFLTETIKCFEVGANRAAIIMCWILAVDHLYDLVLKHHLTAFNTALAKLTDKRVRISAVRIRDDFSDIPEGKFIELLRSSGVISPDVRKILDEKLGIRNSCAHPSGILVKPSKVIEFIDDLIENVVLKYKL